MQNTEIARALERVAALLELSGANPFRVRAYENAARLIESHSQPLKNRVARGEDLTALDGIGKDMAAYITELVTTGKLARLEQLEQEIPPTLIEIMRIPGVGPKKTHALWKALGITTLDQLEKACEEGVVANVKGFAKKTQDAMLSAIKNRIKGKKEVRYKLGDVDSVVARLFEHLRTCPGVERLEAGGSYRRRRETVADLDLLAVAEPAGPAMAHFLEFEDILRVEGAGDTRATVILATGLQVDLRVVPPRSFGAALVYFTGSKAHNIKLRKRGIERGLRLSEYGIFRVEEGEEVHADEAKETRPDPWAGEWLAGREEGEVYALLDLPWIPPELREDRGEVEAAAAGRLPRLIELGDVRGDLHMHTTWSDGRATLEAMVEAAVAKGYAYIAITDHSPSLAMAQGLSPERLRLQGLEIGNVAARFPQIRILRGMEVDILSDGRLDLPDELLYELDWVVASVHSQMDMPAARQTDRIVKALQHPAVCALGHPSGRMLGKRDPMDYDLDAVLECAVANGVALEINGQPHRLDLTDTSAMRAAELGARFVIDSDAHGVEALDYMRYGVDQARRSWLRPEQVLNTQGLDGLERVVREKRGEKR